jgi:hypothetical protein
MVLAGARLSESLSTVYRSTCVSRTKVSVGNSPAVAAADRVFISRLTSVLATLRCWCRKVQPPMAALAPDPAMEKASMRTSDAPNGHCPRCGARTSRDTGNGWVRHCAHWGRCLDHPYGRGERDDPPPDDAAGAAPTSGRLVGRSPAPRCGARATSVASGPRRRSCNARRDGRGGSAGQPSRLSPDSVARRLIRPAGNDGHRVRGGSGLAKTEEKPLLGRVPAAPRGRATSRVTRWVRNARGRLSPFSVHSSKLRLQRFARIGGRRDLGDARSESPSIYRL